MNKISSVIDVCGVATTFTHQETTKKILKRERFFRMSNLPASNLPSAASSPDVLAAFPLSAVGD